MRYTGASNAPKMITATSTEHNTPSSYAFLNSPFFLCHSGENDVYHTQDVCHEANRHKTATTKHAKK